MRRMLPDTFRTARLVLRPIVLEDAGPIFNSYADDPEVTRFLTWRPHQGRSDTDAYIASSIATPPEVARTYVLIDARNSAVKGAFDLRQVARYRVEFGYVLARAWWGQGLMTEALTEVARWALAQPAIFRISAVCDIENIGSARVMEKSGFTREGVLRRWLIHPGIGDHPRDCFSYAKVR
jgi:[ribosomal protein S5]-alanine N-acetyltransferase